MVLRLEESEELTRDVSEIKRNIIIVLFSSTLLLFWWIGDLVFPFLLGGSISDSLFTIITITIFPLVLNMAAWLVWGFWGRLFGLNIWRYDESQNIRSASERYELILYELSKQKRIESFVAFLVASQFIVMGFSLIFGLYLSIPIGFN